MNYLSHALWFNTGANIWQWLMSMIGAFSLGVAGHSRFVMERCEHCWRKGTIPVSGSIHKHCKIHALEHGTTHT